MRHFIYQMSKNWISLVQRFLGCARMQLIIFLTINLNVFHPIQKGSMLCEYTKKDTKLMNN